MTTIIAFATGFFLGLAVMGLAIMFTSAEEQEDLPDYEQFEDYGNTERNK